MSEFLSQFHSLRELGSQKRRKFGRVYYGISKVSQQGIVIKSITKTPKNSVAIAQLHNEANFNFDFQGLPSGVELFETQDTFYLTKPYIAGITIDQYWKQLKKKNRIPFLKTFLEKLSPILTHLETNLIVHGDIKPGNILIKEDSNIELIDFGLATKTDQENKRKTLFPLGFAAPELILNKLEIANSTTDIYALGITIWHLFTNEMPLSHPNPSIYTNLLLNLDLPKHSAINKEIHAILLKMTAKYRFQIPPNKMSESEVINLLKMAMLERYQHIDAVSEAFKQIPEKKNFYQRISLR